jgi:hypothetical protein
MNMDMGEFNCTLNPQILTESCIIIDMFAKYLCDPEKLLNWI